MNEYLIQRETLTGLADEIRVLSGTTAEMSTDAMTNSVSDANTEVNFQTAQIAEISALLEGKSVTPQVSVCNVMIEYQASSGSIPGNVQGTVAYVDQTHTPAVANGKLSDTMIDVTYQVAKDTVLFARSGSSYYQLTACEGEIERLYPNTMYAAFAIHGDGKIILAEQ